MKKQRVVYYDYLRVFAIIAVIVIHVSAQEWSDFGGRSYEWQIFNVYNAISRWGVSVFLMISGSLFLSRDIEIKTLYKKYIPRMVASYFVWSALHAVFAPGNVYNPDFIESFSLVDFIQKTFIGPVHLWFIPMIVGIYMCLPIIRQFVVSPKLLKYYLLLGFIFGYAVPQVVYMAKDFTSGNIQKTFLAVNTLISDMNIRVVVGFAYIFVLGYFLANTEFTKKQRKFIYLLGAGGFLVSVLFNAAAGWKLNTNSTNYLQTFTVNVLLEAVSVFVFFKYRKFDKEKLNAVMSKLSQYSFGAYLVHILVMSVYKFWGFNAVAFNPVFCIPVLTLATVTVAFLISFVLNKIPIVNKWIT